MDRFTKAIEDWLQALQPLFRGLVAHPVLLLVALLFLAVAWGWVGRAYGLTALFWHKSIGTQFLNGLGVSLLFAALCFVAWQMCSAEVAKGCEWSMDWEPARWVDTVLHRVAVAMIRTIACVVMRASCVPLVLSCVP